MLLGRLMQKATKPEMNAKEAAAPALAASPPASTEAAPKQALRPRDVRQIRLGQRFAQTVAVLIRDPEFRKLPIADLEWLVLPPLMAGRCRLAHLRTPQPGAGEEQGMLVPVAVALWARVSPAIDKALSENLDKPVSLRPNEWASGDILWLMAAAGDPRAVPAFLKELEKTEFKGQTVKMRTRGADGKAVVVTLGRGGEAPAQIRE